MAHTLYRVTTKVALYNGSYRKVLLVRYSHGDYGLPGGHIDEGESPDEALRRELREELGLDASGLDLRRTDFWFHPDGKLILGYIGTMDEAMFHGVADSDIVGYLWASVDDIRRGKLTTGTYDSFIVTNAFT